MIEMQLDIVRGDPRHMPSDVVVVTTEGDGGRLEIKEPPSVYDPTLLNLPRCAVGKEYESLEACEKRIVRGLHQFYKTNKRRINVVFWERGHLGYKEESLLQCFLSASVAVALLYNLHVTIIANSDDQYQRLREWVETTRTEFKREYL